MSFAALIPSGSIDVTPSDTINLAYLGVAIRCNGAAGNVSFVDGVGNSHVWPIAVSETITGEVRRINATLTTATNLAVYINKIL